MIFSVQATGAVLPALANRAALPVAHAMPTLGTSYMAQPAVGAKPLAYTGQLPAAPAMPAQATSAWPLAYTGGLSAVPAMPVLVPPGVVHSAGVVAPPQAGGLVPVPALVVAPVPGAAMGRGVPPQAPAFPPQAMAVRPHALAVPPQALAVPPQALAVPPQALAVPPQALAVPTQALVVPPQGSFALQPPAAALAALPLKPEPCRISSRADAACAGSCTAICRGSTRAQFDHAGIREVVGRLNEAVYGGAAAGSHRQHAGARE